MRKLSVLIRKMLKMLALFLTGILVIVFALAVLYKPVYAIYYDGLQIGYTEDKKKMQKEFNSYVSSANEEEQYIELKELPEYKMTFMKKTQDINDENIVNIIKNQKVTYHRYYAITENFQDKAYLETFTQAEDVIAKLTKDESQNINLLAIEERYEEEQKELISVDQAYQLLYIEPPKKQFEVDAQKILSENKTVNTSTRILGYGKPDLGITLIKPTTGVISSVFGHISSLRSGAHSGLDIANSLGTPYVAAADGVVTYVGYNNAYGKMLVITHENGVQTYYCHSNKIYVNVGDVVMQGTTVGEIGSTGNSTRPHLHLEVRINGIPYNPQNYVY